jgi:tetratricopeptide (TPR) repeat protein
MKENNNIEIQKEAPNCAELIKELTKYKEEGCALYKEKKIEEAKAKFKEGFDKFEKESAKISKESSNNEEYKEIIILGKKLLSNLALCYYKQGKYAEAIDYDIKLLTIHPKFGKSIVRLFNSYSRLNKIQQAVYYGEIFLEWDQETRDKFKGTQDKVKREQLKLKNIQKAEKDKIKKDFGKYVLPIVILCLAVLGFMLFRKK